MVHKKIEEKKVIKRSTMVTVVALLGLLTAAAPAMATTEQYVTSYYLGPGAFASGSAHSGVSNTHKNGFHPTCPSVAAGYGGYVSNPTSGGNFTAGANCGTGDRIWYPNGTAGYYFHGAVWNQSFGLAAVNYGRYTW